MTQLGQDGRGDRDSGRSVELPALLAFDATDKSVQAGERSQFEVVAIALRNKLYSGYVSTDVFVRYMGAQVCCEKDKGILC